MHVSAGEEALGEERGGAEVCVSVGGDGLQKGRSIELGVRRDRRKSQLCH